MAKRKRPKDSSDEVTLPSMGKPRRPKDSSDLNMPLGSGAKRTLVALIILGVIGFVILLLVLRSHGNSAILASHEVKLKEYLKLASGRGAKPPEPYVPGKIVTIDANLREIDPTFLDLPNHLCAASPEEVGAIVLLDWQMKDTGWIVSTTKDRKGTTGKVYERRCTITVVDRASGRVTARETVSNRQHADKIVMNDAVAGNPVAQVLSYLQSLPRK